MRSEEGDPIEGSRPAGGATTEGDVVGVEPSSVSSGPATVAIGIVQGSALGRLEVRVCVEPD